MVSSVLLLDSLHRDFEKEVFYNETFSPSYTWDVEHVHIPDHENHLAIGPVDTSLSRRTFSDNAAYATRGKKSLYLITELTRCTPPDMMRYWT